MPCKTSPRKAILITGVLFYALSVFYLVRTDVCLQNKNRKLVSSVIIDSTTGNKCKVQKVNPSLKNMLAVNPHWV